ncbi:MAG: MBL fold metallo-hydrolase [Acidaminococcaceae bacterium]
MLIKTLVENTALTPEFQTEHGLSLYIETTKHKLLFDVGADALFIENAQKLGVKLSDIDLVIISHGHHDHGGGLAAFLAVNDHACIYYQKGAFEPHFAQTATGGQRFIGLEPQLVTNPRLLAVDGDLVLDEELTLLSNVTGHKYWSGANATLLDANLVPDAFAHEQNLSIKQGTQTILITGCSHTGIINILERFEQHTHHTAAVVIGGFHLYNPGLKQTEPLALIATIAQELALRPTQYYTCHCTGQEAFAQLQARLGSQLQYLATGQILEI